jgi:hypothetical protein
MREPAGGNHLALCFLLTMIARSRAQSPNRSADRTLLRGLCLSATLIGALSGAFRQISDGFRWSILKCECMVRSVPLAFPLQAPHQDDSLP